ncbi:MAG TPA: hypothetical protein PLA60_03275 [Candidatus Pacearchaeota archaeon]|jgi:nucleoside 2-deoxyribosyltransferase|nr:hypothetical protein [Candidatus Pacearchaeota archaeon]
MDLNFSVQNKKPVIYLAGHVKEKEYRDYCIEKYSKDFMLFDPIREIDENVIRENNKYFNEKEIGLKISKLDKVAILNSDVLVAYIRKPTFGTIMEIFFAFTMDIDTYIVNENKQYENDYWLLSHSHKIFSNLDNCFNYLKIKLIKKDI